ncbi:hypothetical protein [Vulcanisaeta sp. JCM 14467]|uniref:hypothetical protein n=1 Tax=Vulcanisaeta sp. JCM 14467 TaxID=1295370 RepID=UPI000A405891|nr:hypothetical protein [Vulcanisaeta sp. JCM 14467]
MVNYCLKQRSINIETGPVQLNPRYKFYIYGTDRQMTIVGEAKNRASRKIVERALTKVSETVKLFPQIPRQGYHRHLLPKVLVRCN